MKPRLSYSLLPLIICAALFGTAPARAQTPFTYQGKLENAGAAYTGTVQLRMGLYGVATGGSALRQEAVPGVIVTNGIFTVTLTTFVIADFPGANRWIQIEVSTDGVTYTPLNPRTLLTHTPYAIHARQAETAGSATTITGSLPAGQISGLISPAIMGAGTINQAINFSPAAGAPFSVGNNTRVTNLNSDFFDGLDSAAFMRSTGGTINGVVTLTNPAAIPQFIFEEAGILRMKPGGRGSRLTFGDADFCTIGESAAEDDTMVLTANRIQIGAVTPNYPKGGNLDFGSNTRQMLNLWSTEYGIGVQAAAQYYRSNNNYAWFKGGSHNDATFNAGTGGTTVMTLSGDGELDVKGTTAGYGVTNRNDLSKRWVMYSRNSGPTDQLAFYSGSANRDVAAFSPNGDLYLVGELTTTVLTIRGGADVAEPFEMTKPDDMEPGSVVVIDEENEGKLKLSTEANDARVAGIISGAGGVKPGLRLHQEGVMEGDHHVALSGRVYVKADASLASIKPGDLLTTSSTPGHAMKVRDYGEAHGAILGKAMSRLERGTGLVLVLVSLQ